MSPTLCPTLGIVKGAIGSPLGDMIPSIANLYWVDKIGAGLHLELVNAGQIRFFHN